MQIYLNLDGTLLNVEDRYYAVYRDILEQAGFLPFDKSTYWSLIRVGVTELAIVEKTCDLDFSNEYTFNHQRLIEDPAYLMLDTLQDGVLSKFDTWHSYHALTITTFRSHYQALVAQMEFLGLRVYLTDLLVTGAGGDGWKIKKERISNSLQDDSNAFVIADNETDILAAHALEIPSVAICKGRRTRSTLKQLAPDLMIPQLDDLTLEDWPSVFRQEELRRQLYQLNQHVPETVNKSAS